MPSVLLNAESDYLPAEGFTQGGQGSLKRIAKLAGAVEADYVMQHHPDLPEIQYYASNAVLDCTYVSPLVEKNLEGACPMLVVRFRLNWFFIACVCFAVVVASLAPFFIRMSCC